MVRLFWLASYSFFTFIFLNHDRVSPDLVRKMLCTCGFCVTFTIVFHGVPEIFFTSCVQQTPDTILKQTKCKHHKTM